MFSLDSLFLSPEGENPQENQPQEMFGTLMDGQNFLAEMLADNPLAALMGDSLTGLFNSPHLTQVISLLTGVLSDGMPTTELIAPLFKELLQLNSDFFQLPQQEELVLLHGMRDAIDEIIKMKSMNILSVVDLGEREFPESESGDTGEGGRITGN